MASLLTNEYHKHTKENGKKFTTDELLCMKENLEHHFTIEDIKKMPQEWKRTKLILCRRKEKIKAREQRGAIHAAAAAAAAATQRMEAKQTIHHDASTNDRSVKHDQTTAKLELLMGSVRKLTKEMAFAKSSGDKKLIDTLQKKLQESEAKLVLAQVATQIDFNSVLLKKPAAPIVKDVPADVVTVAAKPVYSDAVVVAVPPTGVPDVPGKNGAVVVADKPIVEKTFEPDGKPAVESSVEPAVEPAVESPAVPAVPRFAASGVPPGEVDGSGSGVVATPALRRSRRNLGRTMASALKHKERIQKGRSNKENNQKKGYK